MKETISIVKNLFLRKNIVEKEVNQQLVVESCFVTSLTDFQ